MILYWMLLGDSVLDAIRWFCWVPLDGSVLDAISLFTEGYNLGSSALDAIWVVLPLMSFAWFYVGCHGSVFGIIEWY